MATPVRPLSRPHAGLLLALVLAVATVSLRILAVSAPWTDEVYTLNQIENTNSQILGNSARDAHPPLYYLALKGWTVTLEAIGFPAGLATARSFGLAVFLVLIAVCWLATRRAIGPISATCVACALALSPRLVDAVAELRQYSLVAPLMPALFFALLASWRCAIEADRRGAWLWAGAGVALGLAALWTHLLSGIGGAVMVGCLMPLLAVRSLRPRGETFVAIVGWAGLVVVLGFLPWMANAMRNHAYQSGNDNSWNTPATVENLLWALAGWMPFGQEFSSLGAGSRAAVMALAAAGLLVPLVGALWAGRVAAQSPDAQTAPTRREAPAALAVGLIALAAFVLFTVLLWLIARRGTAPVFHGPRYPVVMAGLLVAAPALWAAAAAERWARPWVAPAVAAPWLALSVAGLSVVATVPPFSLVAEYRAALKARPEAGPPVVFVMPSNMIPYLAPTWGQDWELAPIESLPARVDAGESATVLRLWLFGADDPRNEALARALAAGRFCERAVENHDARDGLGEIALLRLERCLPEVEALPLLGTGDLRDPAPGRTAAAVRLIRQNEADGWRSVVSARDRGQVEELIVVETPARARLDRGLPRGAYVLRVVGSLRVLPPPGEELRFRMAGEDTEYCANPPAGTFDLSIPVELEADHPTPELLVSRPAWDAASFMGADMVAEPEAFRVRAIWLEPR